MQLLQFPFQFELRLCPINETLNNQIIQQIRLIAIKYFL